MDVIITGTSPEMHFKQGTAPPPTFLSRSREVTQLPPHLAAPPPLCRDKLVLKPAK